MTEPTPELERYQLWTQLCASADHLQRLADEWLDLEPGVQRAHSEHCNLDQLPLFERGGRHDIQTGSSRPSRQSAAVPLTAAEAALLLRVIGAVGHALWETHGKAITSLRSWRRDEGQR